MFWKIAGLEVWRGNRQRNVQIANANGVSSGRMRSKGYTMVDALGKELRHGGFLVQARDGEMHLCLALTKQFDKGMMQHVDLIHPQWIQGRVETLRYRLVGM